MVGPSFGPTKFSCCAVYWIHSYAKVAKKCIYSTLQSYKNNVKNSPRHHSELEGTDSSTCMDGEYYDRWTLIFQIYDASLQSTTFQLSNQLILKVTYPWMPSRKQHIVESTTTVSTQASPVPKLDHYRQPALPNALMNRSSPSRTKECVP